MKEFSPIKYLRLPFNFDTKRLQLDLKAVLTKNWVAHYNKQVYEGDWKSVSLYSINGKEDEFEYGGTKEGDKKAKQDAIIRLMEFIENM